MGRAPISAALLLFSCVSVYCADGPDAKAIAVTKSVVVQIENCPRRERIADFGKHDWVKDAWGPPTDVTFDVEKTNSIIHPFSGIVEFVLVVSHGPHRNTKLEAEKDTVLQPFMRTSYRNTYDITADGKAALHSRELLDAVSSKWEPRPSWSDACWDNITSSEAQKPSLP